MPINLEYIEKSYKGIELSLTDQRLLEAIHRMENLLLTHTNWELSSQLEKLKTSYHYMLQYLVQGIDDPQRSQFHTQLVADAWEIADRLRHFLLCQYTTLLYVQTYKKCQQGESLRQIISQLESFTDDLAVLQLTDSRPSSLKQAYLSHEAWQDKLFDRIWSCPQWSSEEYDAAIQALQSEILIPADLCLLISAVTLSLLQNFDRRKINFALEAAKHANPQVYIRALTCLTLTLYFYGLRLESYSELLSRFQLLKDDPDFRTGILTIYLQLLKAQDTQKVTQKIREEILPEMVRNMQQLSHGIDVSEENDMNPDWGSLNPELDEKIRQMNEMIMEGSDVYMSTFSLMKQYPFFNVIAHWFLPYYRQHSMVTSASGGQPQVEETVDLILRSSGICDSDKYSMLSVFPAIPEQQRQLMIGKFASKESQEIISQNMPELEKYAQRLDVIAGDYIHSLYRFFKLHPYHNEFTDIFSRTLDFYRDPLLEDFLQDDQQLREVGNLLFKAERYHDANELFAILADTEHPEVSDLQKRGFCLQKAASFGEAINAYLKADVMQPGNSWTLRHLGTCYRVIKEYQEALDCYRQVAELQPDNKSVIYQMGICLMNLDQTENALQKFFQLELMDTQSPKVWRAIGWCSFLLDKYDQATQYFLKATAQAAQPHDWLNLGHIHLVQGRLRKAVAYYKEAHALANTDKEHYDSFRDMFGHDSSVLKSKGIDPQLFPLLIDLTEMEGGLSI